MCLIYYYTEFQVIEIMTEKTNVGTLQNFIRKHIQIHNGMRILDIMLG